MPASPRVRSRYETSTPRAVHAATADDVPYSTSSGCATTHSTLRKASSGNGGTRSGVMGDSVAGKSVRRFEQDLDRAGAPRVLQREHRLVPPLEREAVRDDRGQVHPGEDEVEVVLHEIG